MGSSCCGALHPNVLTHKSCFPPQPFETTTWDVHTNYCYTTTHIALQTLNTISKLSKRILNCIGSLQVYTNARKTVILDNKQEISACVNQTYKWKKYVTGNLKASFLSTTKLETKTLSECIRFSGTKETSPSLWTLKTILEIGAYVCQKSGKHLR